MINFIMPINSLSAWTRGLVVSLQNKPMDDASLTSMRSAVQSCAGPFFFFDSLL